MGRSGRPEAAGRDGLANDGPGFLIASSPLRPCTRQQQKAEKEEKAEKQDAKGGDVGLALATWPPRYKARGPRPSRTQQAPSPPFSQAPALPFSAAVGTASTSR